MHLAAGRRDRVRGQPRQACADRLGHRDVRHHPCPEKGFLARKGAIDELVDGHEIARRILLLQRTAGRDRQHVRAARRLQRGDVGAVGHLGRCQPVTLAMARQEDEFDLADPPAHQRVRRSAPDGVHRLLAPVLKPVDRVEARAPNHAENPPRHVTSPQKKTPPLEDPWAGLSIDQSVIGSRSLVLHFPPDLLVREPEQDREDAEIDHRREAHFLAGLHLRITCPG